MTATVVAVATVQHFRNRWPLWRAVRIDKNTDCYVVICWYLYMLIILHIFQSSPNYTKMATYSNASRAQDVCFMYYHILTVTHPALTRKLKPGSLRTQLSQAVPPLKPSPNKNCVSLGSH